MFSEKSQNKVHFQMSAPKKVLSWQGQQTGLRDLEEHELYFP